MPSHPELSRALAFGIPFAFPDDPALALALPPVRGDNGPTTTVRHDPEGIRAAWSDATPTRTREVRQGRSPVLSVDYDESRGYLVCAPGLGSAWVDPEGHEVRGAPEGNPANWEALLIGQVLPLVATVRGLEVFHAAGVVVGDRAHLLCGPQGIGKTTLATHLVIGGAQLLSDDVVALDDQLIAHPGGTVLHVRDSELRTDNSGALLGLRRLGELDGRVRLAVEDPAGARPLGGIYLLERAAAGPAVASVPDPSPFDLLGATFNLSVRTKERLIRHLDLCARLARCVPIFRVRIIPGRGAAALTPELARLIGDHATSLV